MRKIFTLVAGLLLHAAVAQTTVTIGAGATTPASASNSATGDPGPTYRSSASSTFDYSVHRYLYTPAELAAAGLPAGAVITGLAWNKTGTGGTIAGASGIQHQIYLENTSNTALPASMLVADITTNGTLFYSNSNEQIPTAAGVLSYSGAPFAYTGQALEISVAWDCSAVSGNPSTAGWSYANDPVPSGFNLAATNSSAISSIAAMRTVRPQLQITYTVVGCPIPTGLAATSITSSSASIDWTSGAGNNAYFLEVGPAGFSAGSGQSFTGTIAGTAQSVSVSSLLPNTTYEARVLETCVSGTDSSAQIVVLFTTPCVGQLNGTYTVDPALPASATNFTSLSAAIDQLVCGVSGPVTFQLAPGVHTFSGTIGSISGASATNSLTISGTGATITSDGSANPYTLLLNGAQHVFFQQVAIENTKSTTDAFAVLIQGGSDSIVFTGVAFNMPVTTTTDVAALAATGSTTSLSSGGNHVNNLYVSGCTFNGGEVGISLFGSTTVASYLSTISLVGNTFTNQDDHAMSLDNIQGLVVNNNTISMLQNASAIAIEMDGINDFELLSNNILSTDYGIYLIDGNDGYAPTTPSRIANNMILSDDDYALYLNDFESTQVYHNTLVGSPALRINDQINFDLRNNILYGRNDFAFESDDTLTTASDVVNFNAYWSTSANAFDIGPAVYASLANWQAAASAYNANSVAFEPQFISAADLHLATSIFADLGDASLGIATDIDGDARPLAPSLGYDLGADESNVACSVPGTVTFSNLQSAQVDVNMAGNITGTFQMEWGPSGFVQGTGATATFSTLPATLSGLMPGTIYDLYIRNQCSASPLYQGPFSFFTPCAPASPAVLPLVFDFEMPLIVDSVAGNSLLNCFPSGNLSFQTSSPVGRFRRTGFANGGNFAATLDQTTTTPLTANELILTADLSSYASSANLMLDFSFLTHGEESHAGDRVWMRGSTSDSWIEAYDLYANRDNGNYVNVFNIDIDSILTANSQTVSSTFQLKFGQEDNGSATSLTATDGFSFDDIRIREVFCVASNSLVLEGVGADSVHLSWTPGSGLKYMVEYGPVGFVPGTGTLVTTNSPSISLGGLTPDTWYAVVVRDSCDAGNGFSAWSAPLHFLSPCGTLTPATLPFLEGFETYAGTYQGNHNFCSPSHLWRWDTEDTLRGRLRFTTGVFPQTGNRAATLDAFAATPDVPNSLTLTINLSNYTNSAGLEVAFSHMRNGDETDAEDRVWVRGSSNDPWIEAVNLTSPLPANGVYVPVSFDLTMLLAQNGQVVGNETQIRFGQSDNDVADTTTGLDGRTFDDISITELSCGSAYGLALGGVAPTQATINWSGTGTNYNVIWGPPGFFQGTQTTQILGSGTFAGTTAVLSPLAPGTSYHVWVRDTCSGSAGTWAGPLEFQTPCVNALSGAYTVGGAAGATNFATLDSLATTLAICGVSGPVAVTILPGTYNEAVLFDSIPGASLVNQVILDGVHQDSVLITHNGSLANATLLFENVRFITLRNATVESTKPTTDAYAIFLWKASDSLVFENLTVRVPVTTTTDVAGIVASNSLSSSATAGTNVTNLQILNSTFVGGELGISLNGPSTTFSTGYLISGNTFEQQDDHAIEIDGAEQVTVRNNHISGLINTGADAVILEDVKDFVVEGNTILSNDQGLYITDGNDAFVPSSRSRVVNNMVVSASGDAMYLNDVEQVNVFHNSFSGVVGMHMNDYVAVDVRNNIAVSNGDFALELDDVPTSGNVFNYNLYFNQGTGNTFEAGTTGYANLGAFQAAYPALEANGLSGDPLFVSATDLHLIGQLANDVGDATVGVSVDIDGDVRPAAGSTAVDVGADEFTPAAIDVTLVEILAPANGCGGSNVPVEVIIRNIGTTTQTSIPVQVTLGGAASGTLSATYTGSLGYLAQDTLVVGSFNAVAGGTVSVDAETQLLGDANAANNMLTKSVVLSDVTALDGLVAADTVCVGDDAIFYVPTTGTSVVEWYSIGGALLGAGDSLILVAGSSPVEVVLREVGSLEAVGPADNTIGAGGYATLYNYYQEFEVNQPVTIDSVTVYSNGSATVVVNIVELVGNTVVSTDTFSVSAAGSHQLYISAALGQGTYRMNATGTTGSLYRNTSGGAYPYATANGELEIVLNNFDLDYYYYFYNWIVATQGCGRPDTNLVVHVNPLPEASFTFLAGTPSQSGLQVSFDASTSQNASTYSWNFGDGNTGTGSTAAHVYAANGTYLVTLTATGECGSDDTTIAVTIAGIGLDDAGLIGLSIYPNPTNGLVKVQFGTEEPAAGQVVVLNPLGQVIQRIEFQSALEGVEVSVDLSSEPSGVYFVRVETEKGQIVNKVIKN